MSYPDSLMYFANSIMGVSTNVFKVNAQTTGDVGSNGVIRFELPSNTLLNLRKTKLKFNVTTSGTANVSYRLPPLDLLINRISIGAGGIPLDSGHNNHGVLQGILKNMRPDDSDPVDQHSEIYRAINSANYMDLSGVSGTSGVAEVGVGLDGTSPYTLDLGSFFNSVEPSILATDILPSLQVTIFLNNSSVVLTNEGSTIDKFTSNTNGDALGEFTMSNYYLVCPCVAIGDKNYESMIDRAIEGDKYVPVMYHQYYNFSSTYTGDFIGSNGSACLNKLIAVFRNTGYDNTGKAPVAVAGYRTTTNTSFGSIGAPQTAFGALGSNGMKEEYVHPQLDFKAPLTANLSALVAQKTTANITTALSGMPRFNWRVANVMMPNYQVPALEWYELSKHAMDCSRPTKSKSMVEFMENRYTIAQALNLPDTSVRLKSGADMRSSTSQIRLESVANGNLKTDSNIEVFLQCTTELRISSGMRLNVFN